MEDRQAESLTGARNHLLVFAVVLGLWCGPAANAQGGLTARQPGDGSVPNAPSPSPVNPAASISTQDSFGGSVARGQIRPETVPLSFKQAITMGLQNNLGLLLQSDATLAVRGQKWKELSDLLPNV